MKKINVITIPVLIAIFFSGCNFDTLKGSPTVDAAGTANAMVAGTMIADKNMQSTVNSAISLTSTAIAGKPSSGTPTPNAKYYEMSEEELSALIDQSVDEALKASETAYSTTSQASSDNTISEEDITSVETSTQEAEALLNEVDQMIAAYYELYGLYADVTLTTLQLIEQELDAINSSLQSIDQIMVQGAQAATAAINNLNTTLTNIKTNVSEAQTKNKDWSTQVKTELDKREQDILNIKPNEIASDRSGALESLKKYTSSLKSALSDRKISPDELKNIGQLGANATASISKFGGSQLLDMNGQINNMTKLAARGNAPQVQKGLPDFERSVQRRK